MNVEKNVSKHSLWIHELKQKEEKLNYENRRRYSVMDYVQKTNRKQGDRRQYYHGGYYPEWLEQKHDWLDKAIKEQAEEPENKRLRALLRKIRDEITEWGYEDAGRLSEEIWNELNDAVD